MNTAAIRKEFVIKLMGLSSHCAATAEQAATLRALLEKGRINRRDAASEVRKLEGHLASVLRLIRMIAQDYYEPDNKSSLELVKRSPVTPTRV